MEIYSFQRKNTLQVIGLGKMACIMVPMIPVGLQKNLPPPVYQPVKPCRSLFCTNIHPCWSAQLQLKLPHEVRELAAGGMFGCRRKK